MSWLMAEAEPDGGIIKEKRKVEIKAKKSYFHTKNVYNFYKIYGNYFKVKSICCYHSLFVLLISQ
jgi:hypothetical protein